MLELEGKYNKAIVYTDVIDQSAIAQVINMCNQESLSGSNIRIMPDVHAGAGCTIGTTLTIKDKVIPNMVGVDIGCLDMDTEVLTTEGWIKVCNYDNQEILTYCKYTDRAQFERPLAYIVDNCEEFYHLHHTKGLDQMLSAEHKILLWRGMKGRGYNLEDWYAEDLVNHHNSLSKGISGGVKTSFLLDASDLDISDIDLKLNIMVSADGTIRKSGSIEMHFKKQRKIDRCISLLEEASIKYRQTECIDGSTLITFKNNRGLSKELVRFYKCSRRQLGIICKECLLWDGTIDCLRDCTRYAYSTTNKEHADFIQFAFAANDIRYNISMVEYEDKNWNTNYSVYSTTNNIVRLPEREKIGKVKSVDGKKYCFTTSTGYFVIRRNNQISITGNCGMLTVKLNKNRLNIPEIDSAIRKNVHSGFSIRSKEHKYSSSINLEELVCKDKVNIDRAYKSIGTLGGGNHFIEVNRGSDGSIYLVIHTGSRNLGKQIAEHYQNLAFEELNNPYKRAEYMQTQEKLIKELKQAGRSKEVGIELAKLKESNKTIRVPKEMAYCEGQLMIDYLMDMQLAQEYASLNRKAIAQVILKETGLKEEWSFETIHNYISMNEMLLRKGAVSAKLDERLLIPINMRDGSLLCRGKGNTDWNCSAPHGAGRLMSRSEAKQNFTLSEYKKTMKESGIFSTSVSQSTLDECPMAYKNMSDIIDNIGDTVEIIDILKPIYNFKAGDSE